MRGGEVELFEPDNGIVGKQAGGFVAQGGKQGFAHLLVAEALGDELVAAGFERGEAFGIEVFGAHVDGQRAVVVAAVVELGKAEFAFGIHPAAILIHAGFDLQIVEGDFGRRHLTVGVDEAADLQVGHHVQHIIETDVVVDAVFPFYFHLAESELAAAQGKVVAAFAGFGVQLEVFVGNAAFVGQGDGEAGVIQVALVFSEVFGVVGAAFETLPINGNAGELLIFESGHLPSEAAVAVELDHVAQVGRGLATEEALQYFAAFGLENEFGVYHGAYGHAAVGKQAVFDVALQRDGLGEDGFDVVGQFVLQLRQEGGLEAHHGGFVRTEPAALVAAGFDLQEGCVA